MKPDIKAQWIAALRSGEYEQAHGTLRARLESRESVRETYGYCCLGVLCDLASKAGIGSWDTLNTFQDNTGGFDATVLPPGVRRWAGLSQDNPDITLPDKLSTTLANLNDSGHEGEDGNTYSGPYSFRQIADVIEQYIPGD